ncbi:membrane-bound alkaline phosphatase-like protein [Dinothrombium tinctorium]|uniref:Alkaline phosphatase n=1 Tax=Dinothrombium tinctorium TaxID=1965070 RepID=A0A3S3P6E0_9ACAR|nr:membrane-bound alkaline phosphatase-like protein [Dinothrombium tinctorium]
MGLSTVTAARLYKTSKENSDFDENLLSFEKFPYSSLIKVNCLDNMVADSACSGTAYLSGVKANRKTIGVTGRVEFGDCQASLLTENHATSILDWAQDENKATGFVTTTKITHATPASLYAHSASRSWNGEAEKPCVDIAKQLIKERTGQKIKVAFGGGRKYFFPSNCDNCTSGVRKDGENLIESWLSEKKDQKLNAKFITTRKQLSTLDTNNTEFVIGLFSEEHMDYNLEKSSLSDEPSLSEMSTKALQILKKNENGFVLFVEGGRIDTAHHKNRPRLALDETYEMHKAVKAVLKEIDLNETLFIVTADHSHTLTINGYDTRSKDIFGFNTNDFSILLYGNGPGYKTGAIEENDMHSIKATVKSAAYRPISSHGGEDVPLYAAGPGSHLFSGVYDQTYIAHAISYILCMGPQKTMCNI